jgi:alpha-ketoglutarate-dependent taurine dioxygenase
VLEGSFTEQPGDPHVGLRERLLASGAELPEPARGSLERVGLLAEQFDDTLDEDAFLAFGARLGTPMPESHPSVQRFVQRDVILNLVSEHGPTDDAERQPFATNYLTLHTESSGRPVALQPCFIVLMCLEPGDDSADAQTVLVPMAAVARALGDRELAVLSRTRYAACAPAETIVRRTDDRHVFAFRDFAGDELRWAYDGDDGSEDDVNDALRALLAAMYQPGAMLGVRWRRAKLVAIDNMRFFHGRTAGTGATPVTPRHLQRLRIVGNGA